MFISPAYAQAAGDASASGGVASIVSILPLVLIFVVFYFLMIRPQQRRMKQLQQAVDAVKKGDTVTTAGGIVGKVTKVVDDSELEVEVAEGVKLRVVRSGVSEVRVKGEPVKE